MARTLVASDSFTRANGTLGANWSDVFLMFGSDPLTITSNKVRSPTLAVRGTTAAARWSADTFADDQYAKATVTGLTFVDVTYNAGVIARASTDSGAARDFYAHIVVDDGGATKTSYLIKVVNGTVTDLASEVNAWANGDTIEIECEGTTIRAMQNGVELFSTTDSSLTSGYAGIILGGNSTQPLLDDFEAGDLGSDPVALAGAATATVTATGDLTTSAATKGVRVQLHDGTTEQASVTGIKLSWWDDPDPSTQGAPVYQSGSGSTDASGWLEIDIDAVTALALGAEGWLTATKPGATSEDDITFSGRLPVVSI